mmetsp:Transcript_108224/g.258303  ORF Transcript_108224/g.258303 Transcript_108224/m.258303 type:complete len:233 (-) Transcript_108224:1163-1861(-)
MLDLDSRHLLPKVHVSQVQWVERRLEVSDHLAQLESTPDHHLPKDRPEQQPGCHPTQDRAKHQEEQRPVKLQGPWIAAVGQNEPADDLAGLRLAGCQEASPSKQRPRWHHHHSLQKESLPSMSFPRPNVTPHPIFGTRFCICRQKNSSQIQSDSNPQAKPGQDVGHPNGGVLKAQLVTCICDTSFVCKNWFPTHKAAATPVFTLDQIAYRAACATSAKNIYAFWVLDAIWLC